MRLSESQRNIRKLMIEAVDETLKKFFGEAVTSVIYGYLERKRNLRKEEIPEKPEIFSKGLREIFGSGAITIEENILKTLFSKLKMEYKEMAELNFAEVVNQLSKKASTS